MTIGWSLVRDKTFDPRVVIVVVESGMRVLEYRTDYKELRQWCLYFSNVKISYFIRRYLDPHWLIVFTTVPLVPTEGPRPHRPPVTPHGP